MDCLNRRGENVHIKRLVVQYNVGLDNAATRAAGDAIRITRCQHFAHVKEALALHAEIAMHAAMELQHVFAAGRLVQPVDVLRNYGAQRTLCLKLRKAPMRCIRFGIQRDHLVAVILEKRLGVAVEKSTRDNLLRRQLVFLRIETIGAAKVGDAAFGGHACAAEKHHATRCTFINPFIQKFNFFFGLRAHCHFRCAFFFRLLVALFCAVPSVVFSYGLNRPLCRVFLRPP